jgi:hypothetical protein
MQKAERKRAALSLLGPDDNPSLTTPPMTAIPLTVPAQKPSRTPPGRSVAKPRQPGSKKFALLVSSAAPAAVTVSASAAPNNDAVMRGDMIAPLLARPFD